MEYKTIGPLLPFPPQSIIIRGVVAQWWCSNLVVVFGAFNAEGRWFVSHSSYHIGTLGKSITRNCLYYVMWCLHGHLAVKFDSCNNLLTSVRTLLVYIPQCVRLHVKLKYYCYYHYMKLKSTSNVM